MHNSTEESDDLEQMKKDHNLPKEPDPQPKIVPTIPKTRGLTEEEKRDVNEIMRDLGLPEIE